MLKIAIQSNFEVPGLEGKEWATFQRTELTLREFLEELANRSPDSLEYIVPGSDRLDPDDWEVDINEIPYQDFKEGLEKPLCDGDSVTIRILAQGGG